MKTFKKLVLLTSIIMMSLSTVSAGVPEFPSQFKSYEQFIEDPNYYDAERIQDRNAFLNEIAQNPNKRAYSNELFIREYEQENGYYCGPATVQVVLEFLTNTKYSQDSLANDMNTNTAGTYVYQVTNRLNKAAGANTYQSLLTSSTDLMAVTKASIDSSYPVILNVDPTLLPGYSDYLSSGHYIVGYGYSGNNIKYFDTFRSTMVPTSYGKHAVSFDTMEQAIQANKDYYIAAN